MPFRRSEVSLYESIITESQALPIYAVASRASHVDLANAASKLPFARRNILEGEYGSLFGPGVAGSWDEASEMHSTRLYFNYNWTKPWRIYYVGADAAGVFRVGFAEPNAGIEGTWTKYAGNPILQADQTWENASYGIGKLVMVTPNFSTYVGFYQYKDTTSGKIRFARAESNDGVTWTNKQQVVLSSEITSRFNMVGLGDAFYDHDLQKYIVFAHVTPSIDTINARIYGAVLESSDGINFSFMTTIQYVTDIGTDIHAADITDIHSFVKLGDLYVIFFTAATLSPGGYTAPSFAVSRNLKDWYIYPYTITDGSIATRYISFVYYGGYWYGVYIDLATPNNVRLLKIHHRKPGEILLPALKNLSQTVNVPASGTYTITLTPPDGELWRIQALEVTVPAVSGATSGSQKIYVRHGPNGGVSLLYAASPYNDLVGFTSMRLYGATTKAPTDEGAQVVAIRNLPLSKAAPLSVLYSNETNAAQTGTITFKVTVLVEYVS